MQPKLTAVAVLMCMLAIVPCLSRWALAQPSETDAAQVMSAWVVNFARFSEWPASKFQNDRSPIIIGVLGDDEVAEALGGIGDGVTVGQRPVRTRSLVPPDLAGLDESAIAKARAKFLADLRSCHVVYIGRSATGEVHKILAAVESDKVLTVSSIANFAAAGGMLGLDVRSNKVAFDANVEVIAASGITVSSKVLRLARIQKTEK